MQLYYHKLSFNEISTSNWAVILSPFFDINKLICFQKYFDSFWKPQFLNEGCNGTLLWMKNTNNTVRLKHLRSLVKMLLLYNFPVEYTFWQIDKLCISITIWVIRFTSIFYIISFYIITLDVQLFGGGGVLCFKGTKIAFFFFFFF